MYHFSNILWFYGLRFYGSALLVINWVCHFFDDQPQPPSQKKEANIKPMLSFPEIVDAQGTGLPEYRAASLGTARYVSVGIKCPV